MNKRRAWWSVGLFFVIAMVAIYHKPILAFFTLEQAKSQSLSFKEYADVHYGLSVAFYLLAYISIIAFGIPGVAPLSLLGGFLFGIIPGIIFSLIGITGGSLFSYFIMRNFLRKVIRRRYEQQLKKFDIQMERYGSSYLLMIHFSTVVPTFVINALAALANISVTTFIWTTLVGSFPLSTIYVIAGQQLSKIKTIGEIFSPTIILLFVILILLAVVPFIVRKMKSRYALDD